MLKTLHSASAHHMAILVKLLEIYFLIFKLIILTSLYIHDALLQVLKTLDFLARISFIIIEVQCNLMLSRADGKSENIGGRSVCLFAFYLAFPCTSFKYTVFHSD